MAITAALVKELRDKSGAGKIFFGKVVKEFFHFFAGTRSEQESYAPSSNQFGNLS